MSRWKEFLFTGAYTGYFPWAPGTAGTVLAAAIYFAEYLVFGRLLWLGNAVVVALLLYPAVRLCGAGERYFGVKDPPEVVLDEIIGYLIAVLFLPFNPFVAAGSFLLFRLFDIIKPWPAGKLQKLNGGVGIMVDDCVAGAYALAVMVAALAVLRYCGVHVYP